MPEFSVYPILLFIHVAAAIVLMGSTLHAPLARGLVLRASSLAELRRGIDYSRRAAKWNPLAAFVLLGSGLYLASWGWWAQPWLYVAIAAWVANTALAVAVLNRSEAAMARMAGQDGDGPVPRDLDALRRSTSWAVTHAAMAANDAAILFVMFVKPELIGSLALLVGANVVAIGLVGVRAKAVAHA